MATQVEVQTGEVGRTVAGGHLHLGPLTDSSNQSRMEIPSITPEPNKPVPGPKPRLTPKPYAVGNTTLKPILAPKPHAKPRPESTFLAAPKPELSSSPIPQQPAATDKPRPVATNPNRPSSTSFKTTNKLSTGQTTKPVAQPFKPAPPLDPGDPSRPNPPVPPERHRPSALSVAYSKSFNKAPAAEWSGTTNNEDKKVQKTPGKGGTAMTRAKSMGYLPHVGLEEEEKEKPKPEETVSMRPKPRGSRPRPVSAIFLESPTKTEAPVPAPRWVGRRPLSADLTSRFESIGLSLHRKTPPANPKNDTPEEKALPQKKDQESATPQGTDDVAKPAASDQSDKKTVEITDEDKHESRVKSRSSVLLDTSSTGTTATDQGSDLQSPAQPVLESEPAVGVKQLIKQLTVDPIPTQSPVIRPPVKPRPLPLDLTKRFASESSDSTERHDLSGDPQRRIEESDFTPTPTELRTFVDIKEQLKKPSTPEGSPRQTAFGAASKETAPGGDVQTVRASLFENVVERHSVLMMDEVKPVNKTKGSLRSPSFRSETDENQGTLVTAAYKEPVSPSGPLRVLHAFDTVHSVGESRAVSESVPSAQWEGKAMTLRSRHSEGGRPAAERTGEPALESQPRILRVGALPKWTPTGLEQEASTEQGMPMESQREAQLAFDEDRDRQRGSEPEEVAAAPKRLKMLQAEEQPKPRATYFALTGQIQEPVSPVEAYWSEGDTTGPFDDLSVRSAQEKILPVRRNPSLDEALGKGPEDQDGDSMRSHMSHGESRLADEMMEVEKKRELQKETERHMAKMKELEREKRRQLEMEKEAHLEFQRMKERDMQREFERQRQKAFEKEKQVFEEKQRALEREKHMELEKQRLQEMERERQEMERERQERERQRQLEKERRREVERQRKQEKEKRQEQERERQREQERERQREQERERQREEERQRELDNERKLLEIQKEKQRMEELERAKEMERQQLLEFQQQKQKERERQQIVELEKHRLREKRDREEAEKIKQMALEQEMLRMRELEKEREQQRELEKERQKEVEREKMERQRQKQRDLERDRQRQLDVERQEMENQRQRQLDMERQEMENQRMRQRELEKERQRKEEVERLKEMERRQLLEFEKQKQQADRERQHILELEKLRLRERMEKEEAENMRHIAKQQEAERQRLRERQRREEQERLRLESSALRPKVLDLDAVFRSDSFSKGSTPRSDPSTRWKEPSPRAEEPYKPGILDIDSFTSPAQHSPSQDMFPVSGIQSVDPGFGARPQPERDASWKVPPPMSVGFTSPVWTSSPQDPWELRPVEMLSPVEMSVDSPTADPRKVSNIISPEMLLLRQDERLAAPQRHRPTLMDDTPHSLPLPGTEVRTAGSAGGVSSSSSSSSSSVTAEQIWLPRDTKPQESRPQVRGHRRSQGAQELNRMRSRSMSRRSAPPSSAVDGPLARIRSRSAHREQDLSSLVQLKQSGDEEGRDPDTPVRETDSQYGTWETGLRTDDSLTPATPTSEGNLGPSPRKPTPPHTPGDPASLFDADTLDGLPPSSSTESQPLAFPDAPSALLDTSALRSRAQLGKKRAPRTRPTRAARQIATLAEEEGGTTEDWLYRDSTEAKVESKDKDSDSEDQTRGADAGSAVASQPQRVAMFPGMDHSALKAQLKKRGDSDNQSDASTPSPSQLSRSPKSPFLRRAARVLPPSGGKENGEEESPKWLKELKSKKRLSQYENES